MSKIISPMFTGNGAYVIHKSLATNIPDYELLPLSPRLQYFPFVLPLQVKHPTEILHTTPDYAGFFRPRCKKLFLTFHNFVLDDEMRKYSSQLQKIHYRTDLRWFTRWAISQADAITTVSRATADLVKNTLAYTGDMKIIYNGVDTGTFIPPANRKKNDECRILFVGNLTRRKGAHLLPEIAGKINPGCTIYYTNGLNPRHDFPARKNLRSLGAVRHEDMPHLYREMDMVLFPSFREGFSVAVLEAMASSLPVVTSNCSSMPEQIVEGKGGFLCEPGNTDDFAMRLNELADSPQLRHQMGQYNRVRVEQHFSLAGMIDGYRSLLNDLAAD